MPPQGPRPVSKNPHDPVNSHGLNSFSGRVKNFGLPRNSLAGFFADVAEGRAALFWQHHFSPSPAWMLARTLPPQCLTTGTGRICRRRPRSEAGKFQGTSFKEQGRSRDPASLYSADHADQSTDDTPHPTDQFLIRVHLRNPRRNHSPQALDQSLLAFISVN